MKNASNVFNWYEGLVKRAKAGDLQYAVWEGKEGIHDCVELDFNSENDLMTETLCYHPTFLLFYKPLPDATEGPDNDLPAGCQETGEFDFIYSYTANGFGEGLFLDEQHHPELFDEVCSLAKNGLLKEETTKEVSIKPTSTTLITQSVELTLSTGEVVRLEVLEEDQLQTFTLWKEASNSSDLIAKLSLPVASDTNPMPKLACQASEHPTSISTEEFLKEQLEPLIYERYQAVLNQPKLANVMCSLTVNGSRDDIIKEGKLADCLMSAFEEIKNHHKLEVWLPIGETTYVLAVFEEKRETLSIKQTSYLPLRIIELAIPTYKELDEYEQDLMARNLFIDSDVLNAIQILSEKTIYERLDDREEYTLFEDIASDIVTFGSAKEALNELLFDSGCDLSSHRNKLRIKGFVHFATQEKEE